MNRWLLDAGPLIAALYRGDPAHDKCAEAFRSFSGVLITTGAVVTEAMHFLARLPDGPSALVGMLDDADVEIRDCFAEGRLRAAAALMKKYADVPMDFADATLALVAEDTGIADVLTLDRRGFRAYRFRGAKKFRLVLDDL